MEISNDNYSAMHACIKTDNPEAAKLLIDRGMDFDSYSEWAEGQMSNIGEETFGFVQEYWDNRENPELTQTIGGI